MVLVPGWSFNWQHTVNAVGFSVAADRLNFDNLPTSPASMTVTCWFQPSASSGSPAILIEIDQGGGWDVLACGNPGILQHLKSGFATAETPTGVTLTAGKWYFAAMTINGTVSNSYQGDETTAVVGATGTTSTGSSFRFTIGGANSQPTHFPTANMALVRMWNAVLSSAEVEAERTSITPVRTANLAGDWRLNTVANKLVDSSGNGNTLYAPLVGSWTNTTGPTI